MATPVRDKYFLKSLHEEIALFDRKLAHLQRYETFPSEKDRNAAAAKMSVKRGQLVTTARKLAEEGIEFQPAELPRSMYPEGFVVPEPALQSHAEELAEAPVARLKSPESPRPMVPSPFLDEVREFVANRRIARQN
jgi:hypothetical protein